MPDGDETAALTDAPELSANGETPPAEGATGGTAEQNGNGAAVTEGTLDGIDLGLGELTSYDDMLGGDTLSEDDFTALLERAPGLRKMYEGKIEQTRSNAARKREAELRRQVSTEAGQSELISGALAKVEGMTPELAQRTQQALGPIGEAMRAVLRNDVFQEVVLSGESIPLTAAEQAQLGEPRITVGPTGEIEYDHDSEKLLEVTLAARGRQFALDQDAADIIRNHPQSKLGRSLANIAKAAVQKELQAQGIAQAAGATGQQPPAPAGNGQAGGYSLEQLDAMSDEQFSTYFDGLNAQQRTELKAAMARHLT